MTDIANVLANEIFRVVFEYTTDRWGDVLELALERENMNKVYVISYWSNIEHRTYRPCSQVPS